MKSYYEERDENNLVKLRELRDQLPVFCNQFFVGISNITSTLTRLNYARDYTVFFTYLVQNIRRFKGTEVVDFTLDQLQTISQTDIENYLDYVSYYEQDGNIRKNTEEGKTRKLASIRHLFAYLYNKNLLKENVSTKVAMPKKHQKNIIRLDKAEVELLLNEVDSGDNLSPREKKFHDITRLRDLAIVTLLLGTGIRVSECVGINIEDVDFSNACFTITRKGGNRTILYFPDEVYDAVENYFEYRLSIEAPTDALFLSLQNKRIGVRTVQLLVKKYAKIATPLKKITPHKLRSTFGTNLYRETKDIYIVAEVLGHSDVNTTKKHYAAIDEDIKKQAAESVKLRKQDTDEE